MALLDGVRLRRCWPCLVAPTAAELRRMARRHEVVPHRAWSPSPAPARALPGLAVLKQAYARALGIPVEIFVARDYAALIDAQATARVDYAIYSTTAYATAALLCACVEPVVAPVGEDGATGIKAILVTRDGRLSKPADVQHASGRHRARSDSVAGFVLPRLELAAGQVALTGDRSRSSCMPTAPLPPRRCWSTARSMRFSAGCRPMPTSRAFEAARWQRLEAAGMDEAVAVGGVEIVAAQIRPARLAFRSRRRAAHDARRLPDRAQGNRSRMSTTSSKPHRGGGFARSSRRRTMRRRSTWCARHASAQR